MKELGPLASLFALFFSFYPSLPPDTLAQPNLREGGAAAFRDGIEMAGLTRTGRKRLAAILPMEGLDPGLLHRKKLLFPETR